MGQKLSQEQKQALNNVVHPMEDAGVPWALTFGNHDEDATERTGFELDRSFRCGFVVGVRTI